MSEFCRIGDTPELISYFEARKYAKIQNVVNMEKYQVIQDSNFLWPLRIYYEDTDAGGSVYYANYLKFFERARTEWLRHAGINQQLMAEQQQAMFVVKSTSMDYHLPARLDDELLITVSVHKLGRASIIFDQQGWRGKQMLVSGRIKVGCVDTQLIRPCAIPQLVLQAVQLHYSPPLKLL